MDIETGSYGYTGYSSTGESNKDDLKKLLLGTLAGAAVGSLVGALYTEKGVETRTRVSQRSREIATNIKEKAADIGENIKEKATDIGGNIADKVSTVTAPIADKYQSTKKAATKLFAKEKPQGSISHLHGSYDSYDSEDVEISQTKVILALVAGALAGTAIWSFTTEKGKQTRIRAARNSQEVAGKLKVKATKLAEELQKAYDVAKEGMEDLMEKQNQPGLQGPTGANAHGRTGNLGGNITS